MRIQRLRFCNQDWNWSRSSLPGSASFLAADAEPEPGELKKSSNETPASCSPGEAPVAAVPAKSGAGSPEIWVAAWLSACGVEPAGPGGRADRRLRKKAATDCPPVSRAEKAFRAFSIIGIDGGCCSAFGVSAGEAGA